MSTTPYLPSASLVDLLLDAICVVDRDGQFVFVSAACQRIFGYSPAEMVGRRMIEMVHPEDRARTLQAAAAIMSGTHQPSFENRYLRKDGSIAHILWSARWSEDDQVRIAVAHDISERKRSEALQQALYAISEAVHSASDLPGLFRQVHQIIAGLLPVRHFSIVLNDERQDQLSVAYTDGTQPSPGDPLTQGAARLCAEVIRDGRALLLNSETRSRRPPAGDDTLSDWLGVPLAARSGTFGVMILQSDASQARYCEKDRELLQFVSIQVATAIERQRMLTRLTFMAQHDPLTQLPNREMLRDRLHTALARARREQAQLALLFIDLDKFKQVNDSLGHAHGDLLLQQVARRVRQCLREVDTVARFGGDEFVVLLEDFPSPEHAAGVAAKIQQTLGQPFDLQGHRQHVLASIGIALYPLHADDAQTLLDHADVAMYLAKQEGGNRFQLGPSPEQPATSSSKHRPDTL